MLSYVIAYYILIHYFHLLFLLAFLFGPLEDWGKGLCDLQLSAHWEKGCLLMIIFYYYKSENI
jgi:hypothetical protein